MSAITAFTGAHYGDSTEYVYGFMPDLKTADMVYGIGLIAIAVLAIVTRFALAGFKANGPKLLTATYAVSVLVSIIYVIWASAIVESFASKVGTSADLDYFSSYMSVAGSVIMVSANSAYYKKREALFNR